MTTATDIKTKELKQKISEFESAIEDAKALLSGLNENLREAEIELFAHQTGISLGTVFEWEEGRVNPKIIRGKVTGFKTRFGRTQPIVTLYKKDGTLGVRMKDYWYQVDFNDVNIISQPEKK